MNKKLPKLSIIIPVYNVEPYLRKCVDSVLDQDYDNLEIVLVNDGSTDESGVICDEYASASFASLHHSIIPIRVIHKPNGGLSDARNVGVEYSKGDYVCFVDSDDYLCPMVLGKLMEQIISESLDVLRYEYQMTQKNSENKYEVAQDKNPSHKNDNKHDVVSGMEYLAERMDYNCYACQFIIRKELVGEFKVGIHFEDAEWMPRMILKAARVNSTSTMVYNYFIRVDSITQSMDSKSKIRKNIEGKMAGVNTLSSLSCSYPNIDWIKNMQTLNAYYILCSLAAFFYSERKIFINELREMKVFPLQPMNVSRKSYKKITFINNWGPDLFCLIMRIKYTLKSHAI